MISNFFATIGIEVHCALNTKSKMFSNSKNSHNDKPNTNINEIDLGIIGTLPSINKQAVVKAIKLATALHMDIDTDLYFDRKNYFYQDLPKGFQITQQYFPIGKNGYIKLDDGQKIEIERIHLEEDTAKEQVINNEIYLDYNRAGVPLIEIVSKPSIHSASQAIEYLTKLKRILIFLDISDGKMEDGSLRADVNVSISLHGSKEKGQKVELKNLNSFAAIAKAINYEIERQQKELLLGNKIEQSTLKWNEQKNCTEFLRKKENNVDYHYFTEPNIVHILLDRKWVNEITNNINTFPDQIYENLLNLGLDSKIVNQLLDDFDLYKVFITVYEATKNINLTLTWVVVELVSYLKEQDLSFNSITATEIKLIINLLKLLINEDINGKQAKIIFPFMLQTKKEPSIIMEEKNMKQIKDELTLKNMLQKIIDGNVQMLDQYKTRQERIVKFYLGMLMKETQGQANPNVAVKVLIQLINEKLNK